VDVRTSGRHQSTAEWNGEGSTMGTQGPAARRAVASRRGVIVITALIVAVAVLTVYTVRGLRGGSSPHTAASQASTRATATSTATTALVTGDAGDPRLIPVPADIPLADASEALVNEWMPYVDQLTIIPSTKVPYQRPPTPPVTNATAGAVDDATARRWADGLMREFAWENWAISSAQIAFLANNALSDRQVTGFALPEGASGVRITGPRWPSSLRLVKVSQNVRDFLKVSDDYAFLVTFKDGFSVNAVFPDGRNQEMTENSVPAGATGFVVGRLISKPVLGELWYGSASYGCLNEPAVLSALCTE
jgi:hypothetical protein